MNPLAICGSCGKPYEHHHHEDDISYCNTYTNGDTFTDDPSQHMIYSYLEKEFPRFLLGVLDLWKAEHGHNDEGSE